MNTNVKVELKDSVAVWILTILFIVLKLTHVIDWRWLWVLSPLWITMCIWIVVILVVIAVAVIKD